MKTIVATAIATVMLLCPANAANKIYYGSRAGMVVTVLSTDGLDTDHAVIRTKYTREDAERFCIEYNNDASANCIDQQLGLRLNDRISANCQTGEFVDFYGRHFRFEGRQQSQNDLANFVVRDLTSGEIADGSEASGYPVNMQIFRALCPAEAPAERDE
jgi:hypothetical protein